MTHLSALATTLNSMMIGTLALVKWAVTFGTVWWLVHRPGPCWVGCYIWYSMMIGTLAWPLSGPLHLVQYDDWYTGLALVGWAATIGTVWWLVHWPGPCWVGCYIWYNMMIGTPAWPLLGGLLHLVQYDDWYTGLALVKWVVTFHTVWWLVHWPGPCWVGCYNWYSNWARHPPTQSRTSTFTVLTTHPSRPAYQSSYCYWMNPWFGHLQWQQHV